jgi:DNA-binding transcriptional MerR regulator
MAEQALNIELPPIPAKRYFTIGEVSELCGVKPHVLRYWEQEFTQLSPVKRRGNRRYYQHHEVLLIRRIRALLYDDGFTISGARNLLDAKGRLKSEKNKAPEASSSDAQNNNSLVLDTAVDVQSLRAELEEITAILKVE